MTPSASSVEPEEVEEELDDHDAQIFERSPSPEVDLSTPAFDYDLGHANCVIAKIPTEFHRDHAHRSGCTTSPPLERDEREFTQTASAVRERASEALSARFEEPGTSGNDDSDCSTDDRKPEDSSSMESVVGGVRLSEFYSHMDSRDVADQALDFATANTLFDTTPSPSLSSTVSSAESTPVELDDDNIVDTVNDDKGSNRSIKEDLGNMVSLTTGKRPMGLFPDMDGLDGWDAKTPLVPWSAMAHSTVDVVNPETVEVDELDEMFEEI